MRTIPQRELRNNVSGVLREAERGEHFLVTVDGRPVAEVRPIGRAARWVQRSVLLARFGHGQRPDADFVVDARSAGTSMAEGDVDPWERKKRHGARSA